MSEDNGKELVYKDGLWHLCFYYTIWWLGRTISRFYFPVRYRGISNIPKTGPVLLVANHSSHIDPPIIAFGCTRRMTFLAKSELFAKQPLKSILTWLGAFPINRGGGDRAALRTSIELLRKGRCLLMFPEGTRSKDGEMHEPQMGVSMLMNQVPEAVVVPVHVSGSFQAMGPDDHRPKRRRIVVSYGEPFTINDIPDLPQIKKQLYREIGKETMKRILKAST